MNNSFNEVIVLPDYWSHQIAAKRAYALYLEMQRPKPLFKSNQLEDFYFGAQGPDFYYYINRKKPFTKKHYSTLGTHFHKSDVSKTLAILIDFALDSKQPEVRAYVSGYLTHYIIDAMCHPHICAHSSDSKSHKTYELARGASVRECIELCS